MTNERAGAGTERPGVAIGRPNAPASPAEHTDDPNAGPADVVHSILRATVALSMPSAERDRLWMALRAHVCTRGHVWARPLGSACERQIGGDDARQTELVAMMCWLTEHEAEARQLGPGPLVRRLRGVAVRGRRGSVRLAQADAVHGMTHVAQRAHLAFVDQ